MPSIAAANQWSYQLPDRATDHFCYHVLMGDYFQTIVDTEAAREEAGLLASKIILRLAEQGIIEKTLRECVYSGNGMGYPPGPNYRQVVDVPDGCCDYTLGLVTNGLGVIIGRTVFHAGQEGLELVCPKCGDRTDGGDRWDDAVGEWHRGKGDALFACPKCGHAEPVTQWPYNPPWGFGSLGFEFWNWPPLKASFIREVSEHLGHHTVLVRGKL